MNSTSAQEPSHPATAPVRSAPPTSGDRLTLAFLGFVLLFAGACGTWILWHAYQLAAETHRWQPQPCVVIASQLLSERRTPNSPTSYRADIRYKYSVSGESHVGHQIRSVDGDSSSRETAQYVVDAFPVGMRTTCYVKPEDPKMALLKQSSLAPLYSIWFPLLFVLGGVGMMVKALRERAGARSAK